MYFNIFSCCILLFLAVPYSIFLLMLLLIFLSNIHFLLLGLDGYR